MTSTETAVALFEAAPDVMNLPMGSFRYASMGFACRNLPLDIVLLIEAMSEGIEDPRITYHCQVLDSGERFGHGRWHCDGREEPEEVHRLLTVGGKPTLGKNGQELYSGTVWEYSGAFEHKAQPVTETCMRLMIRVSKTAMKYRNHWSRR